MRSMLSMVVLVVGCVDPSAAPEPEPEPAGCLPDLLEAEGETPVDVGAFVLERDYQRVEGTHTDDVDVYRFELDRDDGALADRVRVMVSPIWSTYVRTRVRCLAGEPTYCGNSSSHLFEGACEGSAVDLTTSVVDCDGPAEVVVELRPIEGGNETCAYALDVAVTP